jgi:DNA-binding MarR family transcriptional regulator
MNIPHGSEERLSPEQLEVWRAFDRAHAGVARQLEADLVQMHRLPLAWYEVLARLAEADGRRLRMSQLADMVMLSPSGMTRLIDRMINAGLIQRIPAEQDARGTYAALADAGKRRLDEAVGTHESGVRHYLINSLDDDELVQFAAFLHRIAE